MSLNSFKNKCDKCTFELYDQKGGPIRLENGAFYIEFTCEKCGFVKKEVIDIKPIKSN